MLQLLQVKEGEWVKNAHLDLIKMAYRSASETIHVELNGILDRPQFAVRAGNQYIRPGETYENKIISPDRKITGNFDFFE